MRTFCFDAELSAPGLDDLRMKARAFCAGEIAAGVYRPHESGWSTWNTDFTRHAAEAGFIGMTWPADYGGHGRGDLERFVVIEEMLAASAPVFAHWVADRQTGPQIMKHGSERARRTYLPAIAKGECFAGIGMSEPDSGSDLASVRSRAVRVDGGWDLHGVKLWTTNAHRIDILIALARTAQAGSDRREGLTQFIVDMKAPGVTVSPVLDMARKHELNEVRFDGCFVADDMVVGRPGDGWSLVTAELSHERSGPDRFMTDFQLLVELVRAVGDPDRLQAAGIGRLVAHFCALRTMSGAISALLDEGADPGVEACLVKDLGTSFEQELPEVARLLVDTPPSVRAADPYAACLAETMLAAPSFSLRGGTREVLRGIVARGLGLR